MRLSSSLLVVLAAITMTNAAVVDSIVQPKHKIVRVKNGTAHANALGTAKAGINRKHGAKIVARHAAQADAVAAAGANVDLKAVAGFIHTLSASLESETKLTNAAVCTNQDRTQATLKAQEVLCKVKATLSAAVNDLNGLTASAGAHIGAAAGAAVGASAGVAAGASAGTSAGAHAGASAGASAGAHAGASAGVAAGASAGAHVGASAGASADASAGATVKATAGAAASVAVQHRTQLESINLGAVTSIIAKSTICGVTDLVTLLTKVRVGTVVQADIISVLTEVKLLQAIHDIVEVEAVFKAIFALEGAVTFIELLAKVENLECFLDSLVEIKSVNSLVASVSGGASAIVKLQGAAKLGGYIETYGFDMVSKILCIEGVDAVLKAFIATPGSIQLFESFKAVSDVKALVSGISVMGCGSFVGSVKAVSDVKLLASLVASLVASAGASAHVKRAELLSNAGDTLSNTMSGLDLEQILERAELLSGLDSSVPGVTEGLSLDRVLKRELLSGLDSSVSDVTEGLALGQMLKRSELLSGVSGVTSGLPLDKVLSLRRALAHIAALPDSRIVSIDQAVKRSVLNTVDQTVDNVDLAEIAQLKRSVAALATVSDDEVSDLHAALQARDVLSGLQTATSAEDVVAGVVESVKRETVDLDALDFAQLDARELAKVKAGHIGTADLHRLALVKRSNLLGNVGGTVSDMDLVRVLPVLKRSIADADAAVAKGGYTAINAILLPRHSQSITLLSESLDQLSFSISALFTSCTKISDTCADATITSDFKSHIVPLVATLGAHLNTCLHLKAPTLTTKVDKISLLAEKTSKSLC